MVTEIEATTAETQVMFRTTAIDGIGTEEMVINREDETSLTTVQTTTMDIQTSDTIEDHGETEEIGTDRFTTQIAGWRSGT